MRDELQYLPKSTRNILLNFHNSNQEGIHHVAIFNDKKYPSYFDSYGGEVPQEVVKFMNTKGKGICSDFPIQEFNSKMCGQLSLYVLFKLNQNPNSYCDIILDLYSNINV